MADVTVEFGAQDVGLEKTLKAVQNELSSLQGKVKSGELSMSELEGAMKRIGQVESLEKRLKAMGADAAATSPKVQQLGADLQAMSEKSNTSGAKIETSFGKIGIAAGIAGAAAKVGMMAVEAATEAARKVVDGFGQAIELGGRLKDLSSRTGETAGSLLVLERAFTNTGVGADKVGSSINKMQKFMEDAAQGGATQSAVMDRLGISMGDLKGKTPTEQMGVFARSISGIQDPAQRAQAAMEIFGKSGGELLPILNNFSGELQGARDQLGSMPGVMDRSANAFDDAGDSLAAISSKVMEFAAGFLEQALPALKAFTTALSGVDAAGWGEATMSMIGRVADTLIGAFKDPIGFIEAWSLAYEAGAKILVNALVNGAMTFIDFIGSAFQTQLPNAIVAYVTGALTDSALTFSRYLTEALMTFSTGLSTIPGLESLGEKMLQTLGGVNDSIIAQQLENMGKTKEAASRVVEEFGKAAEKTTVFKEDFSGAEEATKRMKEKFSELEKNGNETRKNFEISADTSATVTNNMAGAAGNSGIVASQFGFAAKSAGAVEKAISNAKQENDKIEESWNRIVANAYTSQKSTLGAEAAITRAAREMSNADFSKGFKGVRETLKDLGGEYEKLGKSGAGIQSIAKSLGLDTDGKGTKRLLIEVQQELEKIGKTPVEVNFKFNKEGFFASLDSLRNGADAAFSAPVPLNLQGDTSIAAVRASAEANFSAPIDLDLIGDQSIQDVRTNAESNFATPLNLSFSGSASANEVLDSVQNIFAPAQTLTFEGNTAAATTAITDLPDQITLATGADTTAAQTAISNIGATVVVSTAADTQGALKDIGNMAGSVDVNLDATKSIESIRASLAESLELDISAKSGANTILDGLKTLVSDIKDLVAKIEPKLPVAALTA